MLNNEVYKKYTAYLISLVLKLDYGEVFDNIRFYKNKLDKNNYYDKRQTVDLICDVKGEKINIEMNNNGSSVVLLRNIEYMYGLVRGKVKRGDEYLYNKVVQININNFSYEGCSGIEEYGIINSKDLGIWYTDKIRIINIYLPKIRERYYNKEEISELEKLLLIFNEEDERVLNKLKEGNKLMEEYVKDSKESSSDNEIIGLYDREKHLEMLHKAEVREGKKEGILEEKFGVAKKMIDSKFDIETIMNITGLSKKEVEELS